MYKYVLQVQKKTTRIASRASCFINIHFLVVFSFFEKTTYCCRTRRLSVRPSVEIISFRGNSLPNRPIELKIGLNVREGVVHVRKAWFFEILIASCKFMQFAIFCKQICVHGFD